MNGISLGDVISNMESELQDANQPKKKEATPAKGAKKPLPKLKLIKKQKTAAVKPAVNEPQAPVAVPVKPAAPVEVKKPEVKQEAPKTAPVKEKPAEPVKKVEVRTSEEKPVPNANKVESIKEMVKKTESAEPKAEKHLQLKKIDPVHDGKASEPKTITL